MTAIPPAALLQLLGAVVLLGSSWPVTRFALLEGAAPFWFAVGRAGLSFLVTLLVLWMFGRLRWPGRADLPTLLALGLLQLAGFFAFAHSAVAWVPAGRTAILSNATLIWTVPLSLLVLGEAISPRRWTAAALALVGIVVLSGPWAIDWSAPNLLAGHGMLLAAAGCWAATMVIVRRWPPVLSMLELLPWAFGIATVVLLPFMLRQAPGVWTGSAWMALAAIGLVAAPIGTWCTMQAQSALPVVVASIGFLTAPAIGVLLAAVWLREPLTPDVVAGALLILGGAGVATSSGLRTRAAPL